MFSEAHPNDEGELAVRAKGTRAKATRAGRARASTARARARARSAARSHQLLALNHGQPESIHERNLLSWKTWHGNEQQAVL